MLDFMTVATRTLKGGVVEVYPKFIVKKSKDLMIRGGDFYAIWNEEKKMWSTDQDDVVNLIDAELDNYVNDRYSKLDGGAEPIVKYMWDSDSGVIDKWHKYCQKQTRDSFHMLDENLIFSNMEPSRELYASKRLNYPLEKGSITAYDKIIGTLYSEEERRKIEWAIGAVVSGDSKTIQKFLVFYGKGGTGKSTILNIIEQLFEGYDTTFDAKALGSANAQFALEPFTSNPLVAIQHDGDLSKIEDNTRLNSLVSHEAMPINEKYKKSYTGYFKCFCFMGTNTPVKITDGKSGLLRRLIDVHPSGNLLPTKEYKKLTNQIKFELGAIAYHCLQVYKEDPGYFDDYIPIRMMKASNDFYNYVIDSHRVFKREDGTTLKAAWEMYKEYCDSAKVRFPYSQLKFQEELRNYFEEVIDQMEDENGNTVYNYYKGFKTDTLFDNFNKKTEKEPEIEEPSGWLKFDCEKSIFDEVYADCPAQLATTDENQKPRKVWADAETKLSDIDSSQLHYVLTQSKNENHVVVDFDIKDPETGEKSYELNLAAANKWPATYGELSKSGAGIHLHYDYIGDVSKLSRIYDDNIEIKVFSGNSSLRRKLTKCNDLPISTISSGLPLKGDDNMINFNGLKSERALRTLIKRHLNKEIMGYTKSSVQMIDKVLNEAYESGLGYDVSDLKEIIYDFALSSNNSAAYCIKLVNQMKFKSEEPSEAVDDAGETLIVFYDVEVFPNLFLVNWKIAGEGNPVIRMINPSPKDIEQLIRYKLIGFNCRRYDNHMLWACMMGYSNEQIYNLSQSIINSKKGEKNDHFFREAYNISYTDVYDYSAKKQSLKKWEIELGLKHHELGLPWDKPVPKEKWAMVAEYCDDDVLATEAVHNHLKGDWTARQILANLAGMSVNTPTNTLTTRIIFGKEKRPKLVYTDLATGEQFY